MAQIINTDVLIIGAGASGLMCAIEAGKRGRKVMVLDHANKAGKKILMSGGGRCNFTNYTVEPHNYLSNNPHFCKSALSRYNQWHFLDLVSRYRIPYHEREYGRLFCNDSASDILTMLLTECDRAGVTICLNTAITQIAQRDHLFHIGTHQDSFVAQSLVVATGGLSIPKMGATPLGYKIAEQFGLRVIATRAGLVPLTLQPEDKEKFAALSGIAVPCSIHCHGQTFSENLLFTHRGLSGPAVLQISSYWQAGESIRINLLPTRSLADDLKIKRQQKINNSLKTLLSQHLPKSLLTCLLPDTVLNTALQDCSNQLMQYIGEQLQNWTIKPNGTEGYRTAEVTIGGVDCHELSSKTMVSHKIANLYFIGEVVDVTGWLGGYNFQWAWSSGWCAGQAV